MPLILVIFIIIGIIQLFPILVWLFVCVGMLIQMIIQTIGGIIDFIFDRLGHLINWIFDILKSVYIVFSPVILISVFAGMLLLTLMDISNKSDKKK